MYCQGLSSFLRALFLKKGTEKTENLGNWQKTTHQVSF
jgi:hypothetical protein